jgi:hypothetical protein
MTVNILGANYTIKHINYTDDTAFEKRGISAYCDGVLKEIVQCNVKSIPGYENESEEYIKVYESETLRHEIVHAFLNESGLTASSCRVKE